MWGLSGLCFADDTLVLARSTEDAQDKMDRVERWMVRNGMRINVQKCGVMAIGMPEAGPVFYQGAPVPRVSKYVYLGVELNDRLDPMEMAQHRLKKGWNALCSMKNVLRNQEIALSLRRQLVSGMLIPRAQFGVALYAHNYACLARLRKIHNRAIAMIAGKPNVCTAGALDELKLPSIHEAAFFFKMKSLASWKRCEAGAGELITTMEHFKVDCKGARRTTWCSRVARSMRRVGLTPDDPKTVMKQKIADYFHSKPKFRPPSKSLTRAAEVSLCKGPDITKLALNGKANAGRRFLIKCRLGTIITRNDLVRMNRIPGGQLGSCLGCGEACDESPEHILLDCPRHDEPRTALLGTIIASIRTLCPRRWRIQLLGWLLGGGSHQAIEGAVAGFGKERESFWQAIAAERLRALWEHRSIQSSF